MNYSALNLARGRTRFETLMIYVDVADLTLLEKTKSRAEPLEA